MLHTFIQTAKHELEHAVKTLIEEDQRLHKRIDQLERELAKARKNSSTSSKPPSSDIVKPPKTSKNKTKSEKRLAGGQSGHPKHESVAFPPEQINKTLEFTLESCPCCGTVLEAGGNAPKVVQQVEILEFPFHIEEHRGLPFWCPRCRTVHYAPLPPHVVKGGLFGARLTALVA